MKTSKESGVAIWYILVGIALFAALSYSFVRSVSQSQDNTSEEQARIIASEILQYAKTLEQAAQKLVVVNGCSENDLSFYSSEWDNPSNYDNSNTPNAGGDYNCHIFRRDGGGVSWKGVKDFNAGKDMFVTSDCNVSGVGTNNPDIVMIIRDVPLSVCKAVNRISNVDMPGNLPNTQPYSCNFNSVMDGTFVTAGTLAGAVRQPTACLEGTSGAQPAGEYFIYSAVYIR